MATHSSTLSWRITWMEEPGRLQSMGSQRVIHDWATSLHFTHLGRLSYLLLFFGTCIQIGIYFLFSFAFSFFYFLTICKASSDNHFAIAHEVAKELDMTYRLNNNNNPLFKIFIHLDIYIINILIFGENKSSAYHIEAEMRVEGSFQRKQWVTRRKQITYQQFKSWLKHLL